jgi:hypothetical protein
MPRPLPLDDDDEDRDDRKSAPRKPFPKPHPALVAAGFLAVLKWLLLAVGALFVFAPFFVSSSNGARLASYGLAGMGCFLGIAARMVQAEEHRLRESTRRGD